MTLAEDTRGRNLAIGQLRRKTKELGTYGHLNVAPLIAAGEDGTSMAAVSKAAEWFEPEDVGTQIQWYLGL